MVSAVTMPPWLCSRMTDHPHWGAFRSTAAKTTADPAFWTGRFAAQARKGSCNESDFPPRHDLLMLLFARR